MSFCTHAQMLCDKSFKGLLGESKFKLSEWLASTRTDGKADALALFILCLDTHCFIQTKSGYWTTLKDDPQGHLEYTQCCNLHLSLLGSGNFIQHEIQTETIAFEIFSLPEPIELDMAIQPNAIGECMAEESETLDKLLQLGITKQSNKDKTESENGSKPSTSQCDVTTMAETSSKLPSAEEKLEDTPGTPSTIIGNPSLPKDSTVSKTSTCTDADNNKTTTDAEQHEPPHTPDVNIQEDSVPVPSVDVDKMAPTTSKEQLNVLYSQLAEPSENNDQAQQPVPTNYAEQYKDILDNQPQVKVLQYKDKSPSVSSLSLTELNYVLNNQPKMSLKRPMQTEIPVPEKLDRPTKPSVPRKLIKPKQCQTQQFKFRLSQHRL